MNDSENQNVPIAADEFSRLLQAFAPLSERIALAVSGGADSMALALCVERWAQRPCIAFVVDHGLRDESAVEAAQVKVTLERIGLPTEILPWQHVPITGRLHEKARAARYQLLTEACQRHGAADLLLAHHRDDQAETILMRLAKGSGVEGLSGMATQSWRDALRLLRPFLSIPKTRLIATCQTAALPFVIDPSNDSRKYARGRLRAVMPLLACEGMTTDSLLSLGARAAEVKTALEHYTQAFLREATRIDRGGSVGIDRAKLCAVPRATALRVLTACLRFVHANAHAPEHRTLSTVLASIHDMPQEKTQTLYGCLIAIAAQKVTILREPAAVTASTPLQPGTTRLWDQRWLVTAAADAPAYVVRALGNPAHDVLDRLAPMLRHSLPHGRIRATLPALWDGNALQAVPVFAKTENIPPSQPHHWYATLRTKGWYDCPPYESIHP
jgi:tRNA(Ile)-lysidine synthase